MKRLAITIILILSLSSQSWALDARGGSGPKGDTGTGCTTLGGDLSGNCGAAVVEQATPSTGTFTVTGANDINNQNSNYESNHVLFNAVAGFSCTFWDSALGADIAAQDPWYDCVLPTGNGAGTENEITNNFNGGGLVSVDNKDTVTPSAGFFNLTSGNTPIVAATLPTCNSSGGPTGSGMSGQGALIFDSTVRDLGSVVTTASGGGGFLVEATCFGTQSGSPWKITRTDLAPATVASVTAITPKVSNAVSATPQNAVGCADTQVTITGAATTMACVASPAGALNAADVNVEASCYVSAASTVQLHLCTIVVSTGAAQNYNIRVIP